MSDNCGGGVVTPPPNQEVGVRERVDWLSVTFPHFKRRQPTGMYPDGWTDKRVPAKPINGYSLAARYADGRVEMTNPDQPNMGTHILLSGTTISNLTEDYSSLVTHFIESGAKIARIDFALDLFGMGFDLEKVWKLADAGKYKCRLRKPPSHYEDTAMGHTIYFGRMKSSAFTRLYDKAIEQKVTGDWKRIETVFRHSRANNAAKHYAKGASVRSLIKGHLHLPDYDVWNEVLNVDALKTHLARVDGDKRLEWLLKSCAPTLAKEIHLQGDIVYKKFIDEVRHELQKLGNFSTL